MLIRCQRQFRNYRPTAKNSRDARVNCAFARVRRASDAVLRPSDDILDSADPGHLAADDVARFKKLRRIHTGSDALGRASGDQVCGLKSEGSGQVRDLIFDFVQHQARVRMLTNFAVHPAFEIQALGVWNLICSHYSRSRGPMGVERFAHGEGGRMALPVARRDIVGDEVTEDILKRVFRPHIFRATSDYKSEFDFII